ncbi:MAG: ribosome biogenesis GTP-binding protein YihA/YsxC [Nitrospinota bacterium]
MPVRVLSAEFVASAGRPEEYPQRRLPQVAFAGRSNVGKSSLINCLLGRKRLVKVSAAPGKTQRLHFFLVNAAFYFADLPGYGYAAVPLAVRARWRGMVERYLGANPGLRGIVVLLDARRGLTEMDGELLAWLDHRAIPWQAVATKSDKLSGGALALRLRELEGLLEGRPWAAGAPLAFSARTGRGRVELWRVIEGWLGEGARPRGRRGGL